MAESPNRSRPTSRRTSVSQRVSPLSRQSRSSRSSSLSPLSLDSPVLSPATQSRLSSRRGAVVDGGLPSFFNLAITSNPDLTSPPLGTLSDASVRDVSPESDVEASVAFDGNQRLRRRKKKMPKSSGSPEALCSGIQLAAQNIQELHDLDAQTKAAEVLSKLATAGAKKKNYSIDSDSDEESISKPELHLKAFEVGQRYELELMSQGVQTEWHGPKKGQEKEKKGTGELATSNEVTPLDQEACPNYSDSTVIGDSEFLLATGNQHDSVNKELKAQKPHLEQGKHPEAAAFGEDYGSEGDEVHISDFGDDTYYKVASTSSIVGPPAIIKYQRERGSYGKHRKNEKTKQTDHDDVTEDRVSDSNAFSPLCEFCGKPTIPLPTIDEMDDTSLADQLYCCSEYKYFLELALASRDQDDIDEDELIDISSHASSSSKISKKSEKERAAERLREREIERQRAAVQQANLFSFSRQIKIIQFSLASPKCQEEGWTVRPATSLAEPPVVEEAQFVSEVNSTTLQRLPILQERYYENGRKLLTIFPDGTGMCYYPNGVAAVVITSTKVGKYTYIVQAKTKYDDLEDSGILAVFEPNANAVCYYKNQSIRLFINARGGIEFDARGVKRKRWQWYFAKGHVHAPPFQPLCFSLNKCISVRLLDQDNISLIFNAQGRSVRFNVGAKIKCLGRDGYGHFAPDSSESYLQRRRQLISSILSKMNDIIRRPKSSRAMRELHLSAGRVPTAKAILPSIVDKRDESVVVS